MVLIKKIEMRNFKTFDKRVVLKIEKGLNVITGPNGSGKSNILDAVKFALGELSPKELRGTSISDVISQTSASNPKKSAYVLIQFENEDRRIPADTDSVSISREFHKTGEGIYRVNGRRVSRKQLLELLSSANIRVSGYNLIPQQSITRLAELTPEERRQVIEDLIGVKVYDEKKENANFQLEKADLNLKIAMAKVGEVKNRIEDLERERNRLLRHIFLSKEKTRLRRKIILDKIKNLQESLIDFRKDYQNKTDELESIKKNRETLMLTRKKKENEFKSLYEELFEEEESELHELDDSINSTKINILEQKNALSLEEKNIKTLRKQKENFILQNKRLEHSETKIAKEIDETNNKKTKLDELIKEKEKIYDEKIEKLKTLKALFKKRTNEEINFDGKISRLRIDEIHTNAHLEYLAIKINSFKEFLNLEGMRKRKTEVLIQNSELAIKDLKKIVDKLSRQIMEIDSEILGSSHEFKNTKNNILDSINTIIKAKTFLLEYEIQNQLINSNNLTKNFFQEGGLFAKKFPSQIFGTVQDFVKIDEKYEEIVKTSFEEWLEAIIVEDFTEALECVNTLHQDVTNWDFMNIIPLKSLMQNESIREIPNLAGIIGRVIDFIECDEKFAPAINSIFENTLIVEDNRVALILSLIGFKAVTLSGELFLPGGKMNVRNPKTIQGLNLIDENEKINELRTLLKELDLGLGNKITELKNLGKTLSDLKNRKIENEVSLNVTQTQINSQNQTSLFHIDAAKDEEKKINDLKDSISELEKESIEISKKKDLIAKRILKINEEIKKSKLDFNESDLKKIEKEIENEVQELRELSKNLAILGGNSSSLEFSLKSIKDSISHNNIQLQEIENEISKSFQNINAVEMNLKNEEGKLSDLKIKRTGYSSSISSKKLEYGKIEEELKNVEEKLRETYENQEILSNSLSEAKSKIKEKEMNIEFLQNELKDLDEIQDLEFPIEECNDVESALRSVEGELSQIGAVNQLALVQYDEQKNNYKQLSNRINELEMEKASILEFIEKLESEKIMIFKTAFDKINESFKEIFSNITSGGVGSLMLQDPERVFEGGVDLLIQFPGKAQLSINSASGGEKSVATVCFILSLQTINPMPFYIFDEIDAHLDISNTQKLADLLKERSNNSQFIVISLKDVVISRADAIYGTYIQSGGSKIVSFPKVNGG